MFRPWEDNGITQGCELPCSSAAASAVCHHGGESSDYSTDTDSEFEERDELKPHKRSHLSADAKQIILNVYNELRKDPENENKGSMIKKTSILTHVPYSTVCEILRKGPQRRKRRFDAGVSKELDPTITKFLRNIIYEKYKVNELPTVESVQRHLARMGKQYPRTTLQRWIRKIGFRYRTVNKRMAIMESARIVGWRHDYLHKIEQYRNEGRSVYYLDETWYDTHDTAKKGWTDGTKKCELKGVPPNKGSRIIILHCGSSDGWVDNALKLCGKKIEDCNIDYHKNMDSGIFEQWFEHTLIPNLKPFSVIVMDNASYHSRQRYKIPNSTSSKAEIQDFLIKQDLYFEETYNKIELLEVLNTKQFKKQYVIENIAKKYGHDVLRLPPYFCIFNPIELIWGQLKQRIRRKNFEPKFDKKVIDLIKSEIDMINNEDWFSNISKVRVIEDEYRQIGRFLVNHGSTFIIDLDDSTDEDEV